MEDKERENKDKDVIDITAEQFSGTPYKEFLVKNNKNTEEKKCNDGDKNCARGEEGR